MMRGAMRCVALMRNVNQGQRGHPSTAAILAGFADIGCPDAKTFQSDATTLFDTRSPDTVPPGLRLRSNEGGWSCETTVVAPSAGQLITCSAPGGLYRIARQRCELGPREVDHHEHSE